jgi:hypothetical protein
MQKIIYKCDVCGSDTKSIATGKDIQVIFTTEENEGRSIDPYLSIRKIDICKDCMQKVLAGHYIYGEGAMGYNKYYFKAY